MNANLSQKIIIDTSTGYLLFGKFELRKADGAWVVIRLTDGLKINFCRLRYACAWCILDRYNRIQDAKALLEVNRRLSSIEGEIQLHKKLQVVCRGEQREINRDKYLVAIDKHKRFQFEIDKYIKLAKNCQDRGYQNELTRTSRK
jgi:hypothetical protein